MRAAFQIALKDLRLRVRDRSVFIIGIIAPLALAFIFSLVFGDAIGGAQLELEYGIVDLDHTDVSNAFVDALRDVEGSGVLTLQSFDSSEAADAAIEDQTISAYFLIPTGLADSVVANQGGVVEVVGNVDRPLSTDVARGFAEQYSSGVAAGQIAVAATAAVSGVEVTPAFVDSLSGDPAQAGFTFTLTERSAETRQLDSSTYYAAGMAVFFLFFTVSFGVTGLLEEERDGTMSRLIAAPIARVSIVSGKAILAFLLGVFSMGILVVATTFLPGLDAAWGNPLGVAILVIAGVLSAVGVMGLVAAVARTPEGAGNLGSIIGVILAMLGGSFFPIASSGGVLATLTYLTPHAWFLRGLGNLANDAPWTEALPAAGAMCLFALVTGSVAFVALRRRLAR